MSKTPGECGAPLVVNDPDGPPGAFLSGRISVSKASSAGYAVGLVLQQITFVKQADLPSPLPASK